MPEVAPTLKQLQAKIATAQQEQQKLETVQKQYMPELAPTLSGQHMVNIVYEKPLIEQAKITQAAQQEAISAADLFETLPQAAPEPYVVISGVSTYGRGGKYGAASATDYTGRGERIGTALGTWHLEGQNPVKSLLTRAATSPMYPKVYLTSSFYNQNKDTIEQWKADNPALASKVFLEGERVDYGERFNIESRAQAKAIQDELKANWGGTLTPSTRAIVEAPIGTDISNLLGKSKAETQQLQAKAAYLQSPGAKWGSQESYDAALKSVTRFGIEVPKPAGIILGSTLEQRQAEKALFEQTGYTLLPEDFAKPEFQQALKVLTPEQQKTLGLVTTTSIQKPLDKSLENALGEQTIAAVSGLKTTKSDKSDFYIDPRFGKMIPRDRSPGISDVKEIKNILGTEGEVGSTESMFTYPIYEAAKGTKDWIYGIATKLEEREKTSMFPIPLVPITVKSIGNLVEFGGMLPAGTERLTKLTLKGGATPIVAAAAAGLIMQAEGISEQTQKDPLQLISDLAVFGAVIHGVSKSPKIMKYVGETEIGKAGKLYVSDLAEPIKPIYKPVAEFGVELGKAGKLYVSDLTHPLSGVKEPTVLSKMPGYDKLLVEIERVKQAKIAPKTKDIRSIFEPEVEQKPLTAQQINLQKLMNEPKVSEFADIRNYIGELKESEIRIEPKLQKYISPQENLAKSMEETSKDIQKSIRNEDAEATKLGLEKYNKQVVEYGKIINKEKFIQEPTTEDFTNIERYINAPREEVVRVEPKIQKYISEQEKLTKRMEQTSEDIQKSIERGDVEETKSGFKKYNELVIEYKNLLGKDIGMSREEVTRVEPKPLTSTQINLKKLIEKEKLISEKPVSELDWITGDLRIEDIRPREFFMKKEVVEPIETIPERIKSGREISAERIAKQQKEEEAIFREEMRFEETYKGAPKESDIFGVPEEPKVLTATQRNLQKLMRGEKYLIEEPIPESRGTTLSEMPGYDKLLVEIERVKQAKIAPKTKDIRSIFELEEVKPMNFRQKQLLKLGETSAPKEKPIIETEQLKTSKYEPEQKVITEEKFTNIFEEIKKPLTKESILKITEPVFKKMKLNISSFKDKIKIVSPEEFQKIRVSSGATYEPNAGAFVKTVDGKTEGIYIRSDMSLQDTTLGYIPHEIGHKVMGLGMNEGKTGEAAALKFQNEYLKEFNKLYKTKATSELDISKTEKPTEFEQMYLDAQEMSKNLDINLRDEFISAPIKDVSKLSLKDVLSKKESGLTAKKSLEGKLKVAEKRASEGDYFAKSDVVKIKKAIEALSETEGKKVISPTLEIKEKVSIFEPEKFGRSGGQALDVGTGQALMMKAELKPEQFLEMEPKLQRQKAPTAQEQRQLSGAPTAREQRIMAGLEKELTGQGGMGEPMPTVSTKAESKIVKPKFFILPIYKPEEKQKQIQYQKSEQTLDQILKFDQKISQKEIIKNIQIQAQPQKQKIKQSQISKQLQKEIQMVGQPQTQEFKQLQKQFQEQIPKQTQQPKQIQIEEQRELEKLILPLPPKPPKEDGGKKLPKERFGYKYKFRASPIFGGAEKIFKEDTTDSIFGKPAKKGKVEKWGKEEKKEVTKKKDNFWEM